MVPSPSICVQPVLLSAFAGLRLGEVCGLRLHDVDFMRGMVTPTLQYPAEPLKTENLMSPVPVGQQLAMRLATQVEGWPSRDGTVLVNEYGRQLTPWTLQRAMRS